MSNNLETAIFAGGCFWCTEAIFERLKGVVSAVSGYSGGSLKNPTYDQVSEGNTNFAECVKIEFDPSVINFDQLLEIFWTMHDPTTLNQQGADIGSQYRSIIFYTSLEQQNKAKLSLEQWEKKGVYKDPIITEILPFSNFYSAEEYHQKFYDKQPNYPYCALIITPKLHKLLEKFGSMIKEDYKN